MVSATAGPRVVSCSQQLQQRPSPLNALQGDGCCVGSVAALSRSHPCCLLKVPRVIHLLGSSFPAARYSSPGRLCLSYGIITSRTRLLCLVMLPPLCRCYKCCTVYARPELLYSKDCVASRPCTGRVQPSDGWLWVRLIHSACPFSLCLLVELGIVDSSLPCVSESVLGVDAGVDRVLFEF